MKKRLILAFCAMGIPHLAQAEDTLIYSYDRVSEGQWAVMPVVADLPNAERSTLFEALRRRKMPTYGMTSFENDVIRIDASKCAYSSIISAEIEMTFEANGKSLPKMQCGERPVPSSSSSLMRYVAVMPIWQALEGKFEVPTWIQVGDRLLREAEFRGLLEKKDKSLARAIEAAFEDPNLFAKTGAMKGYIAQKFPGAEKRVARELESKDDANVSAAMAALVRTRDSAIIARMKEILRQEGAHCEAYAVSMLKASDAGIVEQAVRVLLKSPEEAYWGRAFDDASGVQRVLSTSLKEILDVSTPPHAAKIAEKCASMGFCAQVGDWLFLTQNTPTSQAVAATMVHMDVPTKVRDAALSMLLLHENPDFAYDALDALESNPISPENDKIWERGRQSVHPWIALAAVDHLTPTPETTLGKSIWTQAQSGDEAEAVVALTRHAYDADVAVRRDVASATQWIGTSGDALRVILLRDSNETVVMTTMHRISKRPALEISPAIVKEMTSRVTQAPQLKMALCYVIPNLMNEKTTHAITTYAGSELFDDDERVKIAAIRALAAIAQKTEDPIVADNAKTALALTMQDKSPSIVYHTKKAMEVLK